MKATTHLAAAAAALLFASTVHAQGNPLNAIQAQVEAVQATLNGMGPKLDALGTKLDTLSLKLDALAVPLGMVPFTAQAPGGLCDSGPSPSSNPQIVIEGTGSHLFVVTSILVKTAPQPSGGEGYTFFTVNSVNVDGTVFDTRTGNLMATVSGFGVQESADLMGMPVRIDVQTPLTASPRTESPGGGNFPHQIVADSAGSNDIRIQMFCRADTHDLSVETVRVSGWKWATDSVSVTYVPGN